MKSRNVVISGRIKSYN